MVCIESFPWQPLLKIQTQQKTLPKMYNIYFFLIYLLLIQPNNGYDLLPYTDPTQCNANGVFNVENFQCQFCDTKKLLIPDKNSKYLKETILNMILYTICLFLDQKCVCSLKAKNSYSSSLLIPNCTLCPNNEVYFRDINKCLKCSNGFIKNKISTTCKPCKSNEILVFHTRNGTNLNATLCMECTNGMVPSEDKKICVPCPILNPVVSNGTTKCVCDYKSVLLDNVCVSTDTFPELSNDKRNFYLQYTNREKVKSDLFDNYLKSTIYLCKVKMCLVL